MFIRENFENKIAEDENEHYLEGLNHAAEESYAEAADKFLQAIEVDNEHLDAHECYAQITVLLADQTEDITERATLYQDAIDHFTFCISKNPLEMRYYNARAYGYFQAEQLAKAILDFMVCIQNNGQILIDRIDSRFLDLVTKNIAYNIDEIIIKNTRKLSSAERCRQWNNFVNNVNPSLIILNSQDLLATMTPPPSLLSLCGHFCVSRITENEKSMLPVDMKEYFDKKVTVKNDSVFFMGFTSLTIENVGLRTYSNSEEAELEDLSKKQRRS